MVPGTARYDASPAVLGLQVGHFVVCAAQLEAEDGLEVLALEQDIAFEAVAEVGGVGQGRLLDHFVDARREDEAEILCASAEVAQGPLAAAVGPAAAEGGHTSG